MSANIKPSMPRYALTYSARVSGLIVNGNERIDLCTATRLKKWRASVGKVWQGGGNAKLLIVGDSTVAGSGAGGPGYTANGRAKSWPVVLGKMLNSNSVSSRAEAIIGCANVGNYAVFDPRFVPTGWTAVAINNAIGNAWNSSTSGNVLAFTPTAAFDRAEVYYAIAPSQGTFTINVDGGSTLATVNAAAVENIGVQQITTTLAIHTLNIVKSTGGGNFVLGIRVWDSTTSQVEIFQAGHSGAKTADIANSSKPWSAIGEITTIAPDLLLIDSLINEWMNATAVADFKDNLQTIINAGKISGDVAVIGPCPTAAATIPLATQKVLVDAAREVAVENDCLFIDVFNRWESRELLLSLGYYRDTVHPTDIGYADWAQAVFSSIM